MSVLLLTAGLLGALAVPSPDGTASPSLSIRPEDHDTSPSHPVQLHRTDPEPPEMLQAKPARAKDVPGLVSFVITAREKAECNQMRWLVIFEYNAGWVVELLLFASVVAGTFALMESYYVPALKVMCHKDELNIPAMAAGATVMAASTCLSEVSINLLAMLQHGADLGFGEVMGSAVWDMMMVIGVTLLVCKDTLVVDVHVAIFFGYWILICAVGVAVPFLASGDILFYVSVAMVLLYLLYTYLALRMDFGDPGEKAGGESWTWKEAARSHWRGFGDVNAKGTTPNPITTKDRQKSEWRDGDEEVTAAPAPTAPTAPTEAALLAPAAASPGLDVVTKIWKWHQAPWELLFHVTVLDCWSNQKRYKWWPISLSVCVFHVMATSTFVLILVKRFICQLELSDNAVGSTLLAMAAGVPDLIASAVAAKQGYARMALGNAFGAGIFSILIGLGLPWLVIGFISNEIQPFEMAGQAIVSAALAGASVILIFAMLTITRGRLRSSFGIVLILNYFLYCCIEIFEGVYGDPSRGNLLGSYAINFLNTNNINF